MKASPEGKDKRQLETLTLHALNAMTVTCR